MSCTCQEEEKAEKVDVINDIIITFTCKYGKDKESALGERRIRDDLTETFEILTAPLKLCISINLFNSGSEAHKTVTYKQKHTE